MTPRLIAGQKVVVASHNPGKVREIDALLKPYGLEAISAGQLDLPEPDETETMFSGNARLKARAAADASRLPAIADDSGLCVDALDGAPGIFTARWTGPTKQDRVGMERIEHELQMRGAVTPDRRRGHFVCALCVSWPKDDPNFPGHDAIFEGRAFGTLVWPPRGTRGFGYDPMFLAHGMTGTYGEIEPDLKHHVSHRAEAFRKLEAALLSRP
jgi:XTP/dITP diphosphohydrolase